ncbi:MAG TPA: four helix bundle protein [Bacteroidales bacterium]|nr:four helix bundle protein [Bacteroidales bacterium]
MKLEELQVYEMAMNLGESVWKIVTHWDYLAKDTIGKQVIRSADSVAANLSEGYGRFHFKDAKNFLYYSRGSLFETKTWLVKAKNRNLISDENFQSLEKEINNLSVKLNNYIKSIGKTEKQNE